MIIKRHFNLQLADQSSLYNHQFQTVVHASILRNQPKTTVGIYIYINSANKQRNIYVVCLSYYIYIPRTQLTSIFEGQPSKTRAFSIKTRVMWILGLTIYIFIFILIHITSNRIYELHASLALISLGSPNSPPWSLTSVGGTMTPKRDHFPTRWAPMIVINGVMIPIDGLI